MIKAALLTGAKALATKVTASKAAAAAVVLATGEGASASLSTADITSVLDMVKQVCGLFTMFPINIFLIGGVCGIGFKIFKQGKNAAK